MNIPFDLKHQTTDDKVRVILSRERDLFEDTLKNGPVYIRDYRSIEPIVRKFVDGFPGRVMYAVKANNDQKLLEILYESGISSFDVSSLAEIKQVCKISEEIECFFMNPAKQRDVIRVAYREYGVRTFAVDCKEEITKIHQEIDDPNETILMIRLDVPDGSAAVPITGKFGVDAAEAIVLADMSSELGFEVGITFHVGGQCENPKAYTDALETVYSIGNSIKGSLKAVDIGGGFPGNYSTSEPPLDSYFSAIASSISEQSPEYTDSLLCEPGRALSANYMSVVAKVVLRRGSDLFINDGIYGALSELPLLGPRIPIHAVRNGSYMNGNTEQFRIFGPTCNNIDGFDHKFSISDQIQEGDWLVFEKLGSYSTVLRTGFNGFFSEQFIDV